MIGISKVPGTFAITPHKVSVCLLIKMYVPPVQAAITSPFSSVAQHNRLGLFLFALTKSFDDIFEPKLTELLTQLRQIKIGGPVMEHWLGDNLTRSLTSLSSPDDLFNLFIDLRGMLGGPFLGLVNADQIILDPGSNLGMFLRRCLLAFNLLSFEGVCHLLTTIGTYCKEALDEESHEVVSYDTLDDDLRRHIDKTRREILEQARQYENMDLENFVFEKVNEEVEEVEETEASRRSSEKVSFHIHAPRALLGLIEDAKVFDGRTMKHVEKTREASPFSHPLYNVPRDVDSYGGVFLRTNWQIQGYLLEQADAIEKHGSSFPLNAFESILKSLQKLAPELPRVHFLRYLNNLYHDNYPAALETLHCYFDYSAGTEGFDFVPPSSGCNSFGRYEIALLCLGMMHFHFGHPKQALEVLTEAVQVSQQHSDDICLAYALAAICNLLSEIGFSSTTGILGSSNSCSPVTSMGTSLSIQQQLFVLLRRSLKRAESLNLKRLVASNHLTMAKFDLMHVQRPLLSFGPKVSMKLRTCPSNVCKQLRLSLRLISEFDSEGPLMMTEGASSTAWLKDMQKPMGSLIFRVEHASDNIFEENLSGTSEAFHFCAQPSSIPGSILQLMGASYLLRATSWEIYGSAPLARINALVFTNCFADASSSEDAALAYAKLIQHVAICKGYAEAFAALKIAEEKFMSISKSRILLLKLQLLHEHALHRGHLKLAHQICDELGVLASSVTGVDLDLKTEASLRRARTLLAANQFSQAAAVAHSLFCMCYKFNLQVENATVLLLLAEIHKKSGNSVLGLPYALASLSFCQSFNLDLLKASATLTLAELWLSLGSEHAKRSLALIHGALPLILGHGGLQLRSRAYILEAKCYLSDPSFSVLEDPEVVLDPLRQASEELEVLEYHELATEAYYLLAIVYDKLGQLEEREEASDSFKKHIEALENPQDEVDPLLNML